MVAMQQAMVILQMCESVEEPLKLVDPPYLPTASEINLYTLVLDLDETLVHYAEVPFLADI